MPEVTDYEVKSYVEFNQKNFITRLIMKINERSKKQNETKVLYRLLANSTRGLREKGTGQKKKERVKPER